MHFFLEKKYLSVRSGVHAAYSSRITKLGASNCSSPVPNELHCVARRSAGGGVVSGLEHLQQLATDGGAHVEGFGGDAAESLKSKFATWWRRDGGGRWGAVGAVAQQGGRRGGGARGPGLWSRSPAVSSRRRRANGAVPLCLGCLPCRRGRWQ